MIRLCRCLKIDQTIMHYALELFENFYSSLLLEGRKNGYLNHYELNFNLDENFGVNIFNLTKKRLKFDHLYLQLFNDSRFMQNGRIICMSVCIFIASKLHNNHHIQLSRIRSFLYNLNFPIEFCQSRFLTNIEIAILNLSKFNLNFTTIMTHIETIFLILSRFFFPTYLPHVFNMEKISNLQVIALIIVENFFMMQVPFLLNLFQAMNDRECDFYCLSDIEKVENLNRNKLQLAASFVCAAIKLMFIQIDIDPIVSYISTISGIDSKQMNRCMNATLKFLYIEPYQEFKHNQKEESQPEMQLDFVSLGSFLI